MAYELLFPSSGAMSFLDVSNKLSIGSNLRAMSGRIGLTAPDVFPDDFYGKRYLGFNAANTTVPPVSTSISLSFTAYGSWSITDNQTWLTVSPTSGTGNGTVTVTVSFTANSGASRAGIITLTRGSFSVEHEIDQSGSSVTIFPIDFSDERFVPDVCLLPMIVTRFCTHLAVLSNGDRIFSNSIGTVPFNGNNRYYLTDRANGKQYLRVDTNGYVTENGYCP